MVYGSLRAEELRMVLGLHSVFSQEDYEALLILEAFLCWNFFGG